MNKYYDVTKQGNGANNIFKNPTNTIYSNGDEKNAWVESISASLGAVNANSNIGQVVIFYNSSDPNYYDKNTKMQKINLEINHEGIEGLWKLK